MFICCAQGTSPNEVHLKSEFEGKTVSEIAQILHIKDPRFLALRTPTYMEKFEASCIPTEACPEIILSARPQKYPRPDNYIYISDENEKFDFDLILFFKIKTNMSTEFPMMGVHFLNEEIKTLTMQDVLNRCINIFGYESSNHYLLHKDTEKVDLSSLAQNYIIDAMLFPLTFCCDVAEAAQKKIQHRVYNTQQIIDTEKSYISDLNELITYWEPSFTENKLFNENELKNMFRDVPNIRNSHTVFLESICNPPNVSFATEMGIKFLSFGNFFKVSATFVSQFKLIDEMIKSKSKNKSFESKMKEIEERLPSGTGRDFLSYYVTPVQRYPRYPLLIRDLDKETPAFHPDKIFLEAALKNMDQVNKDIDRSSYTMKSLEVMDTLQKDFKTQIQINDPQRRLVFEAKINLTIPKSGKSKIVKGSIFVFNDLVVIASMPKKNYQYMYHSPIVFFRFSVFGDSYLILFEKKEYSFTFVDKQEKQKFIENIIDLRNPFTNNIPMVKLDQSFVFWQEIETPENIPSLMNLDGCSLNNSSILFGGMNKNSMVNTIIKFTPNDDENSNSIGTWNINLGSIQGRCNHTVTAFDNTAYIMFGESQEGMLNDIWKYDETLGLNQVSPQGEAVIKRSGHSAVEWERKIIIFGGKTTGNLFLNDILVYDIDTNSFIRYLNLHNPPSPRSHHSACIIEDQMIIVGGRTDKDYFNDVRFFNLKNWKWEANIKIDLPYERPPVKSFVCDSFIVLVGGIKSINSSMNVPYLNSPTVVIIIDPKTLKIAEVISYGNMPYNLENFVMVPFSEKKILVFGGNDSLSNKARSANAFILDLSGIKIDAENSNQNSKINSLRKLSLPPTSSEKRDLSSNRRTSNASSHQELIINSVERSKNSNFYASANQLHNDIMAAKQNILTKTRLNDSQLSTNEQLKTEIPAQSQSQQIVSQAPTQSTVQTPTQTPVQTPTQSTVQTPPQPSVQSPPQTPVQTPTRSTQQAPISTSFQESSQSPSTQSPPISQNPNKLSPSLLQSQSPSTSPQYTPTRASSGPVIIGNIPNLKPVSNPAKTQQLESPKIDNRPLEEFFVPGSQFILEDVLSQLQIDANVLQPTELFATKMKARRLWTAYTDNQKIKEKIKEAEEEISATEGSEKNSNFSFFVKLMIPDKSAKVFKAHSTDSFDTVLSKVRLFDPGNNTFYISSGNESDVELNESNLKEAIDHLSQNHKNVLKFTMVK